jgi:hypothetical protein
MFTLFSNYLIVFYVYFVGIRQALTPQFPQFHLGGGVFYKENAASLPIISMGEEKTCVVPSL